MIKQKLSCRLSLVAIGLLCLLFIGCEKEYVPTAPACAECKEMNIPSTAYYCKMITSGDGTPITNDTICLSPWISDRYNPFSAVVREYETDTSDNWPTYGVPIDMTIHHAYGDTTTRFGGLSIETLHYLKTTEFNIRNLKERFKIGKYSYSGDNGFKLTLWGPTVNGQLINEFMYTLQDQSASSYFEIIKLEEMVPNMLAVTIRLSCDLHKGIYSNGELIGTEKAGRIECAELRLPISCKYKSIVRYKVLLR